jgi:hypothetical protein
MNTVSIPSFTAEASLYKTGGRYRMMASGDTALATQAVTPAMRALYCAIVCAACDAGVKSNFGYCWRCHDCELTGDAPEDPWRD